VESQENFSAYDGVAQKVVSVKKLIFKDRKRELDATLGRGS
jgi:hypothetical protein